jgi:trimethylamine--corrinoid protein Co-methyltransferase
MAEGVAADENAQAMDAIREVGPGGHYLGCEHTQNNFKSAFWRSELLDYKPFETWQEEGARDTQQLAASRVETLLERYQAPAMDAGIREALDSYVERRKSEMPDSLV